MNKPDAERLEAKYHADIPLTRALGLRVLQCTPEQVRLAAPLEPNRNDKGTAFAGSLNALMTLAGWGLVYHRLLASGANCDIVIHHGEVRYRAPVHSDFVAVADLGPDSWPDFLARLQSRGRGRILIPTRVEADGVTAAEFAGHYVALARN